MMQATGTDMSRIIQSSGMFKGGTKSCALITCSTRAHTPAENKFNIRSRFQRVPFHLLSGLPNFLLAHCLAHEEKTELQAMGSSSSVKDGSKGHVLLTGGRSHSFCRTPLPVLIEHCLQVVVALLLRTFSMLFSTMGELLA